MGLHQLTIWGGIVILIGSLMVWEGIRRKNAEKIETETEKIIKADSTNAKKTDSLIVSKSDEVKGSVTTGMSKILDDNKRIESETKEAISNIEIPDAFSNKKADELIKVMDYFQSKIKDNEWFLHFDFYETVNVNGQIIQNDYNYAFFGIESNHVSLNGFTNLEYCEKRRGRIRTKIEWENYNYCTLWGTSKYYASIRELTGMEKSHFLDKDIQLLINEFKMIAVDNMGFIRENLIQYAKTDLPKNRHGNPFSYGIGTKSGYKKMKRFMKKRDLIIENIMSKLK